MSPTVPPPITAPPEHPVRKVLEDPTLREELVHHAQATFAKILASRPAALRAEEAEEAVQETLKRALSVQETFDRAAGAVAAWIHGILLNVCFEHGRKLGKRPAQPCSDPGSWERLAARMEPGDDSTELQSLLVRLSESSRQLVTWHYLDGLSHHEIAGRLGISTGCCRTRLSRAIAELNEFAQAKEGAR